MDVGEYDEGELALASFDCGNIRDFKVGLQIKGKGDLIKQNGEVFSSILQSPFTIAAENWAPPLATLWAKAGVCGGNVQPPPVVQPPPPPPPAQQPPAQQPPPPPPVQQPPANNGNFDAFKCLAGTGTNGGKFDAAGDFENVGNGRGGQFITGRCLSNADCGSGCCAKPCGICSGPAVGAAAGKTGCGFDIRNPFAK
jgi:hypothetical protein